MKTLRKNLPLLLAAALLVPMAHAQTAPAPQAAPKPASSPSQYLLDNWNDIGRKLIAMAEDFPEDKYDFKPNPAQRSFAEQLLHAAGASYYFINPVIGAKMPSGDPKPPTSRPRPTWSRTSRSPSRTARRSSRARATAEWASCTLILSPTSKSDFLISPGA